MDSSPTILIVDDHPSFRRCARVLLEEDGFAVVGEAEDGADALQAIDQLHPDVVLLDVQLPDMDGFEVARRLTSNGWSPSIVLTSSRDGCDFGPLIVAMDSQGRSLYEDVQAEARRRIDETLSAKI